MKAAFALLAIIEMHNVVRKPQQEAQPTGKIGNWSGDSSA
jgi:hypothetical protein